MKKTFKHILVLLSVLATTISLAFAGCSVPDSGNGDKAGNTDGGSSSYENSQSGVVSYISTQTEVYSSTAELVEAVADTVVEISTEYVTTQWGMQYVVSGAGSGVIVGNKDDIYYIVTNNHVIDGASEITVATRSGVQYPASLVATDDSADIAVITVSSESPLSIAVWGNSDELKVGEDLIAIGNPLGNLGGTVTKGILSAKGRIIPVGDYSMTLLQTDTAINPGNSGGGLFNMRGELIGVVNAKTSDEEIEGICFAIPANTARAVYGDLLQYGYIKGRAKLNITVSVGTYNSNGKSIVYVVSAPDAAEGTFKQYDRIYSINGKQISSLLDYNAALASVKAGDTLVIEVYRGKVTQSFFGNNITFESDLTSFTVQTTQYGE